MSSVASYHVNQREREIFRSMAPLLVVANHPLGMQDALALLQLVGSVRRTCAFWATTGWPRSAAESACCCRSMCSARGGIAFARHVYRALDRGEALIVFPAGEVSRMGPAGVRDGRWSDGFARLAMRSKAPVLPMHVAARNSAMFYGLSMLAKPLSTAMLPREAVAHVSDVSVSASARWSRRRIGKAQRRSSEQAAD
jgi:putative hemolysin